MAEVFGVDGLVSYRMDEADVLVSFGAEFLETWLSPVAKTMAMPGNCARMAACTPASWRDRTRARSTSPSGPWRTPI